MTREAELELEIARLREALGLCKFDSLNMRLSDLEKIKALSTPPSTTALQELIEKVERRTIERCAEVAKAASLEAERIGDQHELESISRDRMFARAREAGYIVSEIRELPTGNLKLEDLR